MDNAKDSKLLREIKWSILGEHLKLIILKMLQSTKVSYTWVQCTC